VKTEWFEEIFGRGMEKYERLRGEMEEEGRKQDELLEKIRVSPYLQATSEASRRRIGQIPLQAEMSHWTVISILLRPDEN